CCKEIPFVEKLVEKFKGNNKVQFLSISIDQNKEAWLKKLAKDKPQWQQFIIQGEIEAAFSKAWGISGIPRFIMINPDGTIFSADATRPSDAETVSTIEEQIKK
nr:thioredoxin family protein [Prevotella sp.]